MAIFDKFVNAIRINDDDDFDDDMDVYDDEDDYDEEETPKKGFFSRIFGGKDDDDDEYYDEEDDYPEPPKKKAPAVKSASAEKAAPAASAAPSRAKVTPINKRRSGSQMEVSVIKPSSMEDTKEIVDTILSGCTVLLNLEGINMDLAQRILDFGCGASYAISGSLQKVSAYIYILTPAHVEVTGDITDILSTSSIPSVGSSY